MSSKRLLLVEDDNLIRRSIANRLRRADYTVTEAENVAAGREAIESDRFDAILIDFVLPDGTGFDIMDHAADHLPGTPCVMLTAHASIDHAVEAMERGAFTYLQKPVEPEALVLQVARALETGALRTERKRARRLRPTKGGASAFLGSSKAAGEVREMIQRIGQSPARAVLLEGESGVGKGLVARAIHEESDRRDKPFVSLTCSAVPEHLLESELFGHEAGAFTDARKKKMGLLEAADGGTLFLDEIGDMPGGLQAKLLGVLEERTFRPVGGLRAIKVDLRVISATHRDLATMVREGSFREDLFYRLRVVPFLIPPLRDRVDDIPFLAQRFAEEIASGWGRPALALGDDARAALQRRNWPGNVRELRNSIERAVILARGDTLRADDFVDSSAPIPGTVVLPPDGLDIDRLIDELVERALERTGGNQSSAARLLGMSRDQIRYRMQKMGLLRKATHG